jgi:hypothetical protein
MSGSRVVCPRCKSEFEVSEAIERSIAERLRAGMAAEAEKTEKDLRTREQALVAQAAELKKAQEQLADQVAFKVAQEKRRIAQEEQQKAREQQGEELLKLQLALEAKEKILNATREQERKLHAEKVQFEERNKAFDLELARKAEDVKEQVGKERDEAYRLKEEEKNKQMEDLRRKIDELQRKADQGSQQLQGEVLELDLEDSLRRCFGNDVIEPVAKGAVGADVLQTVRDEAGRDCGSIIWESKRTKTWTEGWLSKLKDDKLATKSQLAILVSSAMPKDVLSFECRQNVWVTPPRYAIPLASALRLVLIQTAAARRAADGRHDKMQAVYDYLSGNDFKARVTAIVEAFQDMRKELESEKRAVMKAWAKREKQLERVMANTAGMYGELEGIFGRGLPRIDLLELSTDEDAGDKVAQPALPVLPADDGSK